VSSSKAAGRGHLQTLLTLAPWLWPPGERLGARLGADVEVFAPLGHDAGRG